MNWFKTARVAFVAACLVAAAVLLASLFAGRPARPTAAVSSITTAPISSQSAASGNTALNDLSSRVTQFETIYRGFDWSNPAERQQKLTDYCLPELLARIIQAEQQATVREVMRTKQTTQTVRSVNSVSGEVSDDLAEVVVAVNISKTQTGSEPFEYTIHSKTSWVFYKGSWRVYAVDPL